MDVDTLGRHTHLPGVLESSHHDLRSDLLHIDIWKDDRGIVAAQLESNTLERARTSSHDLLTSGDRASERDLSNSRVLGQHWTKFVVTTQGLENAWRQNFLSQLDDLQCRVRRVRRRLHDYAVASKKSRYDLAEGQNDGEVPWANGAYNTEWSVASGHDFLVIFTALLWDFQTQVVIEEASRGLYLKGSELALYAVSTRCLCQVSTYPYWLARLLAHEIDHVVVVCHVVVFELLDQALALLQWHLAPAFEGLLGSIDGVVNVLLGTDRDWPELLSCRWVDAMVLRLAIARLAVNDVVEGIPGNGRDFAWRHGCEWMW